jgi:thioredoxin-dependent peroxiredoxin
MTLAVGEKAPVFQGIDQDGKTISLKDYSGKKVVLYFYPKDNTPGCTAQACDLRDNYEALQKAGYIVLGISTDNEKSHKKFIEKQNLPFSLIADTEKTIH